MIVDNKPLLENIKKDKQYISDMLKTHSNDDVYPYAIYSFFSRFVEFERFIIDSYINYALGDKSINGYKPQVNVNFNDEETLKKFHKQIDKFVTIKAIKEVYVNMFGDKKNPFSNLFETEYSKYEELEIVRNVIAHQSNEAYIRFYNKCNSSAPVTLNDFMFIYNGNFFNYNRLIKNIIDLSTTIVNPI